jgi:hypothetical protein
MKQGTQDDQECIDGPWKKPAAASESAQGDVSTIRKGSYLFVLKKISLSGVFNTEQFNVHLIFS